MKELRDWDLFGPLFISVVLTMLAQKRDDSQGQAGPVQPPGRCQLLPDPLRVVVGDSEREADWAAVLVLLLPVRAGCVNEATRWLR